MAEPETQHTGTTDSTRRRLASGAALALTGLRVWDGLAEAFSREPLTIRVEGERITAMGSAPQLRHDAVEIPLDTCFAMPGLIDAHVHLCLDSEIVKPSEQQAIAAEQVRVSAAERALAMVRAGITTARDLGGGDGVALDLRERIRAKELPGPRLLCAGQPLTTVGGHCHFWGGEVADPSQIGPVLARQVEAGADWIKVMATGGVMTAGTRSADAQFALESLVEIVERARARGRPVAAHCHGTEGIRRAVAAGVRTVEHCSFAGAEGFGSDFDAEVAASLRRRDLWISPTVNEGWGRRVEHEGAPTAFYQRMRHCLQALASSEVGLIASTDAGIPGVHHHRLPAALPTFARYAGLSNREALLSATSRSAMALDLETTTGVLAAGRCADILVLERDPIEDLAALLERRLVVYRGVPIAPLPAAA